MDNCSRCVAIMLLAGGLAACSSVDTPTINEPPEQPGASSTGGVLFRTVTRGHDIDLDGYLIYVQVGSSSSAYTAKVGANDSVLIKHSDAGWAERWFVRLTTQPNCWPARPNPVDLALAANQVTRIEYAIECLPFGTVAYDRISPHWAGTLEFHGSLSERYLLQHDGHFRLQYASARFGSFEYLGRFDRSPTGVWRLYFGGGTTASATAALAGDSLTVDYNDYMLHSDFEPGVFVRRASAMDGQPH